jgi:hypothetical protein
MEEPTTGEPPYPKQAAAEPDIGRLSADSAPL